MKQSIHQEINAALVQELELNQAKTDIALGLLLAFPVWVSKYWELTDSGGEAE